jgi:tRNA(Arg) A34 adenosine deaminase TadA
LNLDKVYHRLISETSGAVDGSQRYYVGCATLDRHDNIIAVARNSYCKTHPTQARLATKTGRPSREYLHAEIGALVKSYTKAESIVVVRITKRGLTRCARPCDICMLALKEAGVKSIYYSDDNGKLCEEVI